MSFEPEIKPGPLVSQTFTTEDSTAEIPDPTLPALIIGLKVNPVESALAGVYSGENEDPSPFLLPNMESAAKVYEDTVEVTLKNIVFDIQKSTSASYGGEISGVVDNATTITIADENLAASTKKYDTVLISFDTFTVSVALNAAVDSGSDTVLTLRSPLPSNFIGETVDLLLSRTSAMIDSSFNNRLIDETNNMLEVFPGDTVEVTHPAIGYLKTSVKKVIDPDTIELSRSFDSAVDVYNIQYAITRTRSTISTILADKSGSFVVPVSETTTNILQNTDPGSNFASVKAGDSIRLSIGELLLSDIVVSVIDDQRITTKEAYETSGIRYTIFRVQQANASYVVPSGDLIIEATDGYLDDPVVSIASGVTIPVISGQNVKSADVYIGYKAKSTKNAGRPLAAGTNNEFLQVGGVYDISNPLGTGMALAKLNTPTKVLGIPIREDSLEGWVEALDAAEQVKVHALALLTQNALYQSLVRTHVSKMSLPIHAKWRVCFVNLEHPYEAVTTNNAVGATLKYFGDENPLLSYFTLYDPNNDVSNNVVDGYVHITSEDDDKKYFKITEILDDSLLKLDFYEYVVPSGTDEGKGIYVKGDIIGSDIFGGIGLGVTVSYTAFYKMTKNEEAQALAARATAMGTRRAMYFTNEQVKLDRNGVASYEPGYYGCAVWAGLSSGTPPHQGLTGVTVAGLLGVTKGSEYFGVTEQGIISAGGGFLAVQDSPETDSAPYCWRQNTSDKTSLKTSEYSITKNVDEICYAIYDAQQKVAGPNNVVPATIDLINDEISLVLESRTVESQPTNTVARGILGPQIISHDFSGYVEDPVLSDTIFTKTKVTVPSPLNRINTEVIV